MHHRPLATIAFLSLAAPVFAQGSSELDLFAADAALKAETTVASIRPATVRETPGVVSIVTRDEIVRSGARDLIDVLRNVPGFSFGVDVEGIVDLGFRGVWGHEGKILLMVDGLEMNEQLFGTLQLGRELPVDQIQAVEIIRGPGSALYGGNAELAVINVKTRGASELHGAYAAASYSQASHDFGQRNLSLQYGQTYDKLGGLAVSISGWFGQANRSERPYNDLFGASSPTANGGSRIDPGYLNLGLEWKSLKLRFVYHDIVTTAVDGYGDAGAPVKESFTSMLGSAMYELKVNDQFRIVPEIQYKRQLPWRTLDKSSVLFYDKTSDRFTGRLTAIYEPIEQLTLAAGGEAFRDRAWLNDSDITGGQTLFYGSTRVEFGTTALFSEATARTPIVNIVAGARFEHHSLVGSSFVPRLALTKVIAPFHFKVLYSQAFRAPALENLALNPLLTPERTTVVEGEAGVQIAEGIFASLNVFDLTIRDPIIYSADPATGEQIYQNFRRTGSRGAEAELRLNDRRGSLTLGYSYYTAGPKNQVDLYATPDPARVLAFPAHKLTARASINLGEHVTVDPSASWISSRYTATGTDSSGNATYASTGSQLLLDLFATARNLGFKGVELGLGVHNLLDAQDDYIQPYNSSHAPLPGPSREWMARLSYQVALP
ncbi:MAG TPA: TonB-dependent receptor plug domain-containing protein [Myxococcales bacterium]|nr:TonB-dependent receptor plug domain-containing protein [Myxococcales bacterium]